MQLIIGTASSFGERSARHHHHLQPHIRSHHTALCWAICACIRASWSMHGLVAPGWPASADLHCTCSTAASTCPSSMSANHDLQASPRACRASFLVTLPWVLVYLAGFFLVLDRSSAVDKDHTAAPITEQSKLISAGKRAGRYKAARIHLSVARLNAVDCCTGRHHRTSERDQVGSVLTLQQAHICNDVPGQSRLIAFHIK